MTRPPSLLKRDFLLFAELAHLRVLDSEQLFHLAEAGGAPIGAIQHRRRLKQLFEHGYLDLPSEQRRLWRAGEGSRKNLYALGRLGAAALRRHLRQNDSRPSSNPPALAGKWTAKNRAIRADTLEHLLMVSRFYTALARACTRSGLQLHWWSGWQWPPVTGEGQDPSRSAIQGRSRAGIRTKLNPASAPNDLRGQRPDRPVLIPIRPDACFQVHWIARGGDRRNLSFFLEADRGTEVVAGRRRSLQKRSLFRKYVGYWNWLRNERGHRAFGLDGFAVLTATTSRERASNLSAAATAAVSRGPTRAPILWSAAESDYLATPEDPERFRRLFSPIWPALIRSETNRSTSVRVRSAAGSFPKKLDRRPTAAADVRTVLGRQ